MTRLPDVDLSQTFSKRPTLGAGAAAARQAPPVSPPVTVVTKPAEPARGSGTTVKAGTVKPSTKTATKPPGWQPASTKLSIDQPVAEKLRSLVKPGERSVADIILDAIEATYDQLPTLLKKPATSDLGKFAHKQSVPRTPVLVGARFLPSALKDIDELASQLNIKRSTLVEAALRQHLGVPTSSLARA